mgnify:FL=1
MKNIFFLNFWEKGGMKHYSDSLVNILLKDIKKTYITNYHTNLKCKRLVLNIRLNPFK